MNLRYSELKHNGQIYTEQWKIDEILIDNKFNWMVNAEIKNARLEIFKDTLVWNGGIWYNGDWFFGVWRDGEWKYGTWQNGVWYSGTWQNGTFKSGIIYNGKFFKGKIEGGEIRGGVFINVEISSNVVEYTSDEYQAKKEEEQQPAEQPTTAVAQSNQPIGQVRVNGTKPAAQQIQNIEQPQIQQEKLITKFKVFEELVDWEKELIDEPKVKKFKIGDIVQLKNNRFWEDEYFKIDEIDPNYDDHGQKSEDKLDGKYHLILIEDEDDSIGGMNTWRNSVDMELVPDVIIKQIKYNL